jgi:hypothetical protein
MNRRKLEQLRMLADWQLRQLGYNPAEITRLCQEADEQDAALDQQRLGTKLQLYLSDCS